MIHVGMGPTHLVNILGQCNIPPPSEPSIRKHEAKVGKTITDVALESCRAAQVEEKQTSDTVCRSFFSKYWYSMTDIYFHYEFLLESNQSNRL